MKHIRPGKKGHRARECAVPSPWEGLAIPKAPGALHPHSQQPCKADAY